MKLEKYNWDDKGKILNLPQFLTLNELFNEYSTYKELDQNEENLSLNHNIKVKVIEIFEKIAANFITDKESIILYENDYNLTKENKLFFWENQAGEAFYIRPVHMLSMFESSLVSINNRLFTNSVPIKRKNEDEDNKYFELLESDQKAADEFRDQFYISLNKNSTADELNIFSKLIIEAISEAFKMKIIKQNYNGNQQLNNEIIDYINNLTFSL